MMKMAFLGLGLMGSRLAERLLNHYGSLIIWNRTTNTCNTLSARGATVISDLSKLPQLDIIALCLADDSAVSQVMQHLLPHMQRMGEPLVAALESHMSMIRHIQFADVPGRGHPGSGEMNFKAIFDCIEHSGYKGYYSAEYINNEPEDVHLQWFKQYLTQISD